jgi:magnesium transporter
MEYDVLLSMLEKREFKELKDELENMHPVDIVEMLEDGLEYGKIDKRQMILLFRLLAKEEAAEVFTDMTSDTREVLINALTDSELEEVMEEMYVDDTVDVLEEMPANVVDRLLMATDEETRQKINALLNYPEDSAGSIMNIDYISLNKEMTVADAILKIRQVGINKETIYTCYVTEKKKLIGVVDVKDILTSGESRKIEEIMDENVIYAKTLDDQEVAETIRKYGLIAIPIIDHEMCMVGIVTVDDAMFVLQDEATEDISIMAGVSPSEGSYFGTSVFRHAKNRSLWLMLLMLSATVTGEILGRYESAMAVMPVLITFIPMLMGTGGNCGSQSSTLVIRGIAVGEIEFKDIFRVIFKEVRIALVVSLILAMVNGLRIYIMYDQDVMLAVAIGITMIAVVVMAKKIGLDPAIMAAPLITTILDTCTILVYFRIVTAFFHI